MNSVSAKYNLPIKGSPERIIPGFRITLGFTVFYLSLIILLPLSALVLNTFAMDWSAFIETVTSPRVMASYKLSFGASFLAGLVNVFFGTILTWVLVRYRFPGRRIIDALIDLPFALPTAVAGIALTALYSQNGWIGRHLEYWGIKAAFTPVGVTIALIFIGLPFIVRTLQPVLEELEVTLEEAAASLGANRIQTFGRVIFPAIFPAIITGFSLAFARALGEYGSVIFIAGNMPMVSEITPLFIVIKLEQYDYAGATAIAAVMLLASFLLLLAINLMQAWVRRRNDGE